MKRNDILLILIPSLLFVLAWTGFSIYHNFINSTISESLDTQILPISPTFDTTTITALKNRMHVDPIYEVNQSAVTTSTLDNSQNQNASSSAEPTITPTPTINNSINTSSSQGGTLSQWKKNSGIKEYQHYLVYF